MDKKQHVKITKISPQKNGLKEGYYVKGFLNIPIEEKGIISCLRYERNGCEIPGFFNSSQIKSIVESESEDSFDSNIKRKRLVVNTLNSVYQVDFLD